MPVCVNCGRYRATDSDVEAWNARPACVERGDCRCATCSEVCWSGSDATCAERRNAPTSTPAEGGGS